MNILIDLETLGTVPGSAILSIGAYCLEDDSSFYQSVDLKSCFQAGLSVSADTINWWMKQSAEARSVFTEDKKLPIEEALRQLSMWITVRQGKHTIWGDGATFDCVLLECAYIKTRMKCPWHYTQVSCYRTLKKLFPEIAKDRLGVYHRADDDAKSNGKHLKLILDRIGV